MTRINLGIEPAELCDAHLLAEYRELPRIWRFRAVSAAPPHFTLGKGHVLWCAQYPRTLADRFASLVAELEYRGFAPQFRSALPEAATSDKRAPEHEIARARPILQARIIEKLGTGKRAPRWTMRDRPAWTLQK